MDKGIKSVNKIIGDNIRYERKKRNMTIEEFSEVVNIASGFLGLIERGERGTSIKNLCKISEFFNITLDELKNDLSKKGMKKIESKKEKLIKTAETLMLV